MDQPSRLRADTLASSVVILLAASIVQRTVGFGRGILYCRWLEPQELGQWEMAYSFLLLAAPLAVLGVPGCFGRYVGHYRQQGRLTTFLRRTATWTALWGLSAVSLLLFASEQFSEFIFGRASQTKLVGLIAACLAAVILHHFMEALFTGLRMFRVVSVMHFAQSVGFAAISLSLLAWWRLGATSIVIGYGAACLLSAVGAISWLRPALAELTSESHADPLAQRDFWPKLLRFAFWVWLTNLLANLFAVIDRYMLVHYGNLSEDEALVQVGLYHSSRVVPLLLLSVADLLSSIVLPHLSHDWEAGRREAVHERLNLVLKTASLLLLSASVCVLLFAPLLFNVAFQGKYAGGLAILPLTLAYCTWNGVAIVAMTYLWCAERTGLSTLPMGIALALNVLLNLVLVPRMGLTGAVVGTTIANSICLASTLWLNHRVGMRIDRGTIALAVLPVTLLFGTEVAIATLVGVLACAVFTSTLFNEREKQQFEDLRSRLSHVTAYFRTKQRTFPAS
jgi:O-antigen/teichoic acid export membrane protein